MKGKLIITLELYLRIVTKVDEFEHKLSALRKMQSRCFKTYLNFLATSGQSSANAFLQNQHANSTHQKNIFKHIKATKIELLNR